MKIIIEVDESDMEQDEKDMVRTIFKMLKRDIESKNTNQKVYLVEDEIKPDVEISPMFSG